MILYVFCLGTTITTIPIALFLIENSFGGEGFNKLDPMMVKCKFPSVVGWRYRLETVGGSLTIQKTAFVHDHSKHFVFRTVF